MHWPTAGWLPGLPSIIVLRKCSAILNTYGYAWSTPHSKQSSPAIRDSSNCGEGNVAICAPDKVQINTIVDLTCISLFKKHCAVAVPNFSASIDHEAMPPGFVSESIQVAHLPE